MTYFQLIKLSIYVLPSVDEVGATPHMTRLAYACASWDSGNYAESLAWVLDWDELPQCVTVDYDSEQVFLGFYLPERGGWEFGDLGAYIELRAAFEQFLLNSDCDKWDFDNIPDGAELAKVHRAEWIRETKAF